MPTSSGAWSSKPRTRRATDSAENIVFDNVRTQAQFDILKQYGFQLVRVTVNPITQMNRATLAGVSVQELYRVSEHTIENNLATQEDEIEVNGGVSTIALASYLVEEYDSAYLSGR